MRDYQKENEWAKQRYTLIKAHIDKKTGDALKKKLQKNKTSIASWIRENAIEYLKD